MIVKNILIRIAQQLLQFLIMLAIARFIGPQGNGVFSIFITDVSFFILLLGVGGESAILYFSVKKEIDLPGIVSLFLPLLVFQIIACLGIFYFSEVVYQHLFFKTAEHTASVYWAMAFIISTIIFNYCSSYLNAQKVFFKIFFWIIIAQLLFLLALVAAYKGYFGNYQYVFKTEVLIPFYTCLYLFQSLVAILLTIKINHEKIVLKNPFPLVTKGFLIYMLTVYVGNLLQFFAYRMDIWILDHFHSKTEVGLYSLAVKISQLFWVLPQIISMMLFPLTALNHESASEKKFNKTVLLSAVIGFIGAIFLMLIYPIFISATVGNAYKESYEYFIYLLPGVLLFSISILLAARLAGKGNVKINMQTSAICFLVILTFDLLLIPGMKGKGAAIAASIGYSVSAVFILMKYLKWIKK